MYYKLLFDQQINYLDRDKQFSFPSRSWFTTNCNTQFVKSHRQGASMDQVSEGNLRKY